MPNTLIVGTQYGDEAKGKFSQEEAPRHSGGAKISGANNAGHTYDVDGESLSGHYLPSPILHEGKIVYIGGLVTLHPGGAPNKNGFFEELDKFAKKGFEAGDRLYLSRRIHLTLPYHFSLEEAFENILHVGTTKKGVGPTAMFAVARMNPRITDLKDKAVLKEKIKSALAIVNPILKAAGIQPYDVDSQLGYLEEWKRDLLDLARPDSERIIKEMVAAGASLLLEGNQGIMLDPYVGSYPYVTSLPTGPWAVDQSLGFHLDVGRVIGVIKTPMSRVGGGPFPTEVKGHTWEERYLGPTEEERHDNPALAKKKEGQRQSALAELRGRFNSGKGTDKDVWRYFCQLTKEFGTTTGRPRRLGWLDMPQLRYVDGLINATEYRVAKFDSHPGLKVLKLCVAHKWPDGTLLPRDFYPVTDLGKLTPVYKKYYGFPDEDISGARTINDFPPEARAYLYAIRRELGKRITEVSVGKRAEEVAVWNGSRARHR